MYPNLVYKDIFSNFFTLFCIIYFVLIRHLNQLLKLLFSLQIFSYIYTYFID